MDPFNPWKEQVQIPEQLTHGKYRKIKSYVTPQGFLGDGFLESQGIIFLGDNKHTDKASTMVCGKLKVARWNLGSNTESYDSMFRLGVFWIKKLQRKLTGVVICPPSDEASVELISVARNAIRCTHTTANNVSKKDEYSKKWFSEPENAAFSKFQNITALRAVCNEHNVPFVDATVDCDIEYILTELQKNV